MKYSILVPVYNVDKYLTQCIESIRNQTYKDFELILVDDGSIDESGALCDYFSRLDQRIKVIHKENDGLMMARKTALEMARGDYVLFADSDDYISELLLETVDEVIVRYQLDLLVYNLDLIFKNKIVPRSYGNFKYKSTSKNEMIKLFATTELYNSVATKVIRRSLIIDDIDTIYRKINYAEDALQTAYFLEKSINCGILNVPLYHYRMRRSSLVKKNVTINTIMETFAVMLSIKSVLNRQIIAEEFEEVYFRRVVAKMTDQVMCLALIEKKYKNYKGKMQCLINKKEITEVYSNVVKKQEKWYKKVEIRLTQSQLFYLLWLFDNCIGRMQQINNRVKKYEMFD